MENPEWIEHKGKKILYCDFSGFSEDEMIDLLEKEAQILEQNGKTLIISNFANTAIGKAFWAKSKELVKTRIQPNTEKSAILGVEGLKAIMLKANNAFSGDKVEPMKSLEAAKDYVTS